MKNKLSDSRVLNGLFDLILNLPLGDRRTVGIREYEPLDVSNLGLLQICFYFGQDLPYSARLRGGTCFNPCLAAAEVQPDDSRFRIYCVFRDSKKIALRKAGFVSKFRQAAHPRRIDSQELFFFIFGESSAAAFSSNNQRLETGTKARGGKVVDIFEALQRELSGNPSAPRTG